MTFSQDQVFCLNGKTDCDIMAFAIFDSWSQKWQDGGAVEDILTGSDWEPWDTPW